jgi:hypothetical protein
MQISSARVVMRAWYNLQLILYQATSVSLRFIQSICNFLQGYNHCLEHMGRFAITYSGFYGTNFTAHLIAGGHREPPCRKCSADFCNRKCSLQLARGNPEHFGSGARRVALIGHNEGDDLLGQIFGSEFLLPADRQNVGVSYNL